MGIERVVWRRDRALDLGFNSRENQFLTLLVHRKLSLAAFGEEALAKALLLANMIKGLRYAGDFEGTLVYEVTTS